jgi:BirA family biotin operon repressor/biotin-[acetyl-CoA-carboxylase] ligase
MSDTLGREIRARIGEEEITGTAEDIDETGALLVRTDAGLRRILSGDVEFVRAR